MIELIPNPRPPKSPRWLKLREAADYANMSEKVLRRHLLSGEIYGTKRRGEVWIIDRESIDRFYLDQGGEDEKWFDLRKRVEL